jgi:hypothetical protein
MRLHSNIYAPSIALKYRSWVEVVENDERKSLLRYEIDYGSKKFDSKGSNVCDKLECWPLVGLFSRL